MNYFYLPLSADLVYDPQRGQVLPFGTVLLTSERPSQPQLRRSGPSVPATPGDGATPNQGGHGPSWIVAVDPDYVQQKAIKGIGDFYQKDCALYCWQQAQGCGCDPNAPDPNNEWGACVKDCAHAQDVCGQTCKWKEPPTYYVPPHYQICYDPEEPVNAFVMLECAHTTEVNCNSPCEEAYYNAGFSMTEAKAACNTVCKPDLYWCIGGVCISGT